MLKATIKTPKAELPIPNYQTEHHELGLVATHHKWAIKEAYRLTAGHGGELCIYNSLGELVRRDTVHESKTPDKYRTKEEQEQHKAESQPAANTNQIKWYSGDNGNKKSKCHRFEIIPHYSEKRKSKIPNSYSLIDMIKSQTIAQGLPNQRECKKLAEEAIS